MTTKSIEARREAFEAWLGIKPCGAAHVLAYQAFKAGAAAVLQQIGAALAASTGQEVKP